jgi:hypothetical protein
MHAKLVEEATGNFCATWEELFDMVDPAEDTFIISKMKQLFNFN